MTASPSRRTVIGAAAAGSVVVAAGAATLGEPGSPPAAVAATPGVLDLYINEGFVPMVDGSLVYMRGFGERPTAKSAAVPSLTITPRVFLANGRLVKSRAYPLGAKRPPEGRPAPNGRDETRGGY